MDISSILIELRQERVHLQEAILSLERLARGGKRRRGRPPAWMALARSLAPTPDRRRRPVGSKNRTAGAIASAT